MILSNDLVGNWIINHWILWLLIPILRHKSFGELIDCLSYVIDHIIMLSIWELIELQLDLLLHLLRHIHIEVQSVSCPQWFEFELDPIEFIILWHIIIESEECVSLCHIIQEVLFEFGLIFIDRNLLDRYERLIESSHHPFAC